MLHYQNTWGKHAAFSICYNNVCSVNDFFGTDIDLTYCDITAGKTEAKKENYKIKTSCTSIDEIHNSKSNKQKKEENWNYEQHL